MAKVAPEDVRLLKELQALDLEIMGLEKQKQAVPPEISSLVEKIASLKSEEEELSSEINSLSDRRRESEHDLDDRLSELEKLRSQKNLVSTNEAYTALLKEIEHAEQEQNRAEEDILVFMERAEELSKAAARRKDELSSRQKELGALKEENRKRIAKLDGELSVLRQRWETKAGSCSADVLPLYEKTRNARGGLAFVAAEGGVCTGCSMELRPQVVSELMRGEVLVCESCSRLMYLDVEENP